MSGQALRILRRSSLAQTINAFIGLFTCGELRAPDSADNFEAIELRTRPEADALSFSAHKHRMSTI